VLLKPTVLTLLRIAISSRVRSTSLFHVRDENETRRIGGEGSARAASTTQSSRQRAVRIAVRRRSAPRARRHRDVTLGAVIVGSQVDFRMAAGPWWAAFLLAVLGLAAVGARIVFPQDSPDKLAWWREHWRLSRRGGAGGRRRTRREGRE
jgi:hypothetical protein